MGRILLKEFKYGKLLILKGIIKLAILYFIEVTKMSQKCNYRNINE